MSTVDVNYDFDFEAAHWLPKVTDGHKCKQMHGHSYKVTVTVTGEVREDGMVVDYADIKAAVDPMIAGLDHRVLNDIIGLDNPTCENLCIWFWIGISDFNQVTVTVHETAKAYCTYRGE